MPHFSRKTKSTKAKRIVWTEAILTESLNRLLAQGKILYCSGCEEYRDASKAECQHGCNKAEDPTGLD